MAGGPAETERGTRADRGARAWALAVDLAMLGFVGIGLVMLITIVSVPFWDPGDATMGVGGGDARALDAVVPAWLSAIVLGALGLLAVVLSGALARTGPTLSQGLRYAELDLVLAPLARRGHPAPSPAVAAPPGRWRVAARWLTPLGLFAAVTVPFSGVEAAAVAIAAWAPALFGDRRSLYDVLAGVVVVDAAWSARTRRARLDQSTT